MRESAAAAQREQAGQQGLIVGILALPLKCFGMLCGSLLLSILIECIGMHWFWREESWHHAQKLFEFELSQLSSYFTHSILIQEPSQTAHRWIDRAFDFLFVNTGVIQWFHDTTAHVRADANHFDGLRTLLGSAYIHVEAYVIAASYTILTCLVRLIVLFLTLPLFALAAFVGFIDGLVRRDIRRFEAGRESAFVYHRARASLVPLAVLPWVIYLALPVSVHPLLILLPTAILLSIATNITAASFKKYL